MTFRFLGAALAGASALVALLGSCASQPSRLEFSALDGRTTIVAEPGRHFTNQGWFGPIPFTKGPQLAVWEETPDGQYLKTLFVTARSSTNDWIGTSQRPEALPVWAHRRASDGGTDAVSAATGSLGKITERLAALGPGSWVYLEVNLSYDWNTVWAKDLPGGDLHFNGVNGQPSLIYRAKRDPGRSGPTKFELIGRGSATGADGALDPDLTGIDTARDILTEAWIEFR